MKIREVNQIEKSSEDIVLTKKKRKVIPHSTHQCNFPHL